MRVGPFENALSPDVCAHVGRLPPPSPQRSWAAPTVTNHSPSTQCVGEFESPYQPLLHNFLEGAFWSSPALTGVRCSSSNSFTPLSYNGSADVEKSIDNAVDGMALPPVLNSSSQIVAIIMLRATKCWANLSNDRGLRQIMPGSMADRETAPAKRKQRAASWTH